MKLKVKNITSKKFKKGINVQLCSNLKVRVHTYNVQIQCRVVDKSVRLALVWGDGPGDPWVMGHVGHGSLLSDPFPALTCRPVRRLLLVSATSLSTS